MATSWTSYLDLSAQQQREQATALPVLQKLLQALQAGAEPPPEIRRRLLSALLASADSVVLASSAATPPSPALLALYASLLKFLGRSPAGSEELGRQPALKLLLKLGGLARAAALPPATATSLAPGAVAAPDGDDDDDEQEEIEAVERDLLLPHESEALRCLCNVLTLHPSARDAFPEVLVKEPDRLALKGMRRLLGCEGAGFLAGRLLFLLTSKPGELISELAEDGESVEALQVYALRYIRTLRDPKSAASLTGSPMPSHADTLREHLKFAYNLMLQYGRQPPSPTPAPAPAPSASATIAELPADGKYKSETEDDYSDDSDKGAAEVLSTSPQPKKKRFWSSLSKGSGETLESGSPTPEDSKGSPSLSSAPPALDPSSDPSLAPVVGGETRRSKSPRFYARKIKDAVTGSPSSSKQSTPSTSPNLSSTPSFPQRSPPLVNGSEGTSSGTLTLLNVTPFLPLFQPYLTLSCLLPLGDDPKDPSPLLRGALNTLLNYPIELEELDGFAHSWLQPVKGSEAVIDINGYSQRSHLPPLVARLMEVLSKTCDAWFPLDAVPASSSSSQKKGVATTPAHPDELIPKGAGDSSKVEEILGPVMLLLRKISLLAEPAGMLKELLLPDNIDRSVPFERRPDLLGHLVRLLSSLLFPNTAYGVGEFLYNLCDRDPTTLCTQIGYGNASGFLQNRGELIPPPPIDDVKATQGKRCSSASASEGEQEGRGATPARAINPITGAFELPPDPDEVEMTEEEKVREAEKLYVLFDRMARTGVMDVENPVQKGAKEGRFEETSEEREAERKRFEEEEERLEKEVEREMEVFRARKKAVAERAKAEAEAEAEAEASEAT